MKITNVLFVLVFASSSTLASDNWVSGTNQLVRDSQGQCIRNGVWTPATAHPDCVPDLQPKPQPVAAPAPAPRVVTPVPASQPSQLPPAPAPQRVTLQADALFDFDRSVIKPEGRAKLTEFASQLKAIKADVVIVVGHTDSIGSDAYNLRLGQRRAEAVRAFLISQGVRQRIDASSRGEREPVADNRTAAGRAKNRRVVIEVQGTK